MILRKSGAAPQRLTYPATDVLRAELDAFAGSIENKNPFPVREAEVLATLVGVRGGAAVDDFRHAGAVS